MQQGIQKGYEAVPAYEQIKIEVVNRLIRLTDLSTELSTFKYLKKKDAQLIAKFKAEILSFYMFLKPKMLDNNNQRTRGKFDVIIKMLDYFVYFPSKFKLSDALYSLDQINQFCEEYRLTSVTFWSGNAFGGSKEKSTYNV